MSELRQELLGLRGLEHMTLDDLVDEAARLLPAIADRQTRYKVSERPDARTIRYYVTRGLLPRATGYEGGRARYGGEHLLRLLAIKKLQAEHHTLTRIDRTLAAADDRTLLGLLLGEDPGPLPKGEGSGSESPDVPSESDTPEPDTRTDPDVQSGIRTAPDVHSRVPRVRTTSTVPITRTVRRIDLPGGAILDVPLESAASRETSEELAHALEAAARALREGLDIDLEEKGADE